MAYTKIFYSTKINSANVMIAGIKSHKDILSARGLNDDYLSKFEKLVADTVQINTEQEKAKAELKTLTKKLVDHLDLIENEIQYCKRGISNDFPIEAWHEFGLVYHERGALAAKKAKAKKNQTKDDKDQNQGNQNQNQGNQNQAQANPNQNQEKVSPA